MAIIHAHAQAVSSQELINNAAEYDGKEISYEGEVIGEIMKRKDYVWMNVFDGGLAVGVWANKQLLPKIDYVGGYQVQGEQVLISGVFNRKCPEHGADAIFTHTA